MGSRTSTDIDLLGILPTHSRIEHCRHETIFREYIWKDFHLVSHLFGAREKTINENTLGVHLHKPSIEPPKPIV